MIPQTRVEIPGAGRFALRRNKNGIPFVTREEEQAAFMPSFKVGDTVWTKRLTWNKVRSPKGEYWEGHSVMLRVQKAGTGHICTACVMGIPKGVLHAVEQFLRSQTHYCLHCVTAERPDDCHAVAEPVHPDPYAGMRCPVCKVAEWSCRSGGVRCPIL